jgi:hypothetical protein
MRRRRRLESQHSDVSGRVRRLDHGSNHLKKGRRDGLGIIPNILLLISGDIMGTLSVALFGVLCVLMTFFDFDDKCEQTWTFFNVYGGLSDKKRPESMQAALTLNQRVPGSSPGTSTSLFLNKVWFSK